MKKRKQLLLYITFIIVMLLIQACSSETTDHWFLTIQYFFEDLTWWEWIIFILIIVLVIIALVGIGAMIAGMTLVEALAAIWAFLVKIALWIWEKIFLWIFNNILAWPIAIIWTILEKLGIIALFSKLWSLIGGNVLFAPIAAFFAWLFNSEEEIPLLCGGEPYAPAALTLVASETERDMPWGLSAQAVSYEAVRIAEENAKKELEEKLQKIADRVNCVGDCQKVVQISVSIVGPTPTPIKESGILWDSYTAYATATGTVVVRCVIE